MKQTPFARWMKDNQPDPHGGRYYCAFEQITAPNINTFVLAEMTPFLRKAFTQYSSTHLLTAAKDRLRWLSRQLAIADSEHDKYNKARAELSFGELTDDELANCIFTEETEESLNAARERMLWLDDCIKKLNKFGSG